MAKAEIEEFAQILIREVRDNSITSCDILLDPESNDAVAKRLRKISDDGSGRELAKALIPECVDDVLFHLLQTIDSGRLQLSFKASNGKMVDLTKDGEMAGWYITSGEWREKYSEQRYVDDFDDLTID